MSRHLAPFIGIATALLASPAGAQMFMCEIDGRKTYSDRPCGSKQQLIEVRPAAGGASINPGTSLQNVYYDIRGVTFEDLRREIAAKGPEGRWWGTAQTRLTYQYTTRSGKEGCIVDTVRANADSQVRLPRWVNRFEGERSAQDRWDAAFRSLDLHERGHVQISVDGAKELERVLREIPPQQTCDATDGEIKSRYRAIMDRIHERQRLYDLETDHGRKQWSPYRP